MITKLSSFIPFIVGALSSFFLAFPSLRIAGSLKLIDLPSSQPHKTHKKPTPLAGGITLFAGIILLNILFPKQWETLNTIHSLLAIVTVFFTGLLDDKFVLKPQEKMFGQLIASILLVLGGFHTNIFMHLPAIDIFISLVWYLGIINAFNFMDSTDGIILEIGLVISSALVIFSQLSNQPDIQLFCFAFLGLQIGLLYFNVSPAKLFLGDSGAQMIGLVLAVLTLMYNPLGHDRTSSWITPIFMMSVPIFDVTLVVISRLRRNAAIYSGGLDHTFHRLVRLGFSHLKAKFVILTAVAITNFTAYLLLKVDRVFAYVVLTIAILVGAILIGLLEKVTKNTII